MCKERTKEECSKEGHKKEDVEIQEDAQNFTPLVNFSENLGF